MYKINFNRDAVLESGGGNLHTLPPPVNQYANYGIGIATNSGRATATVSSSAIGGACALTRACFPARYLLGDDIAQTPAQAPPRAAPQAPASAQARGRALVPIPAIGHLQEVRENGLYWKQWCSGGSTDCFNTSSNEYCSSTGGQISSGC